MPEQRYEMNIFNNELQEECWIVWSLTYNDGSGDTPVVDRYDGITLQIDERDTTYTWLVVYYEFNQDYGDSGPGTVTLTGTF